ncbi:uncharacterized protein LOC123658626 [Melitaea cinxia]|uniref:uncharacterized protein LOC123658626 n=1 Tax=Melitaea cinxia TaxID=113334 RepID=UPI001E27486B|nr:uncharacterized protein LOC123658626 [Melitaea cinxia]
MKVPECEEIYIGGDFNGHVGRMNDGYERVHGGRGYGVRNRDGEALLEAALAFDLAIANTFYQKREQHLITYRSGLHSTQIDYILLRRNRLKSAKDCKVIPSESLVSQHRLLLLDLTLKVQSLNKSPKPPVRTKWYRLDDREVAAEFRERVVGKMIEMGDMVGMGVNECWSEMAMWVRSVARDVLGETKGKRKIEKDTWWWNEERHLEVDSDNNIIMTDKCSSCGKFVASSDGVKCSKCNTVHHKQCVNVSANSKVGPKWYCKTCKRKPTYADNGETSGDVPRLAEPSSLSEEIKLLRSEINSLRKDIMSVISSTNTELQNRLEVIEERLSKLENQHPLENPTQSVDINKTIERL